MNKDDFQVAAVILSSLVAVVINQGITQMGTLLYFNKFMYDKEFVICIAFQSQTSLKSGLE